MAVGQLKAKFGSKTWVDEGINMVKRKDTEMSTKKKIIIYIITVIFSVLYIIVGREIAMQGYPQWDDPEGEPLKVKITAIVSDQKVKETRTIVFDAKVLSGEIKGQIIRAEQQVYDNYYPQQEPVETGDRVLVYEKPYDEGSDWAMLEYVRSHMLLALGIVFVLAVLAFGRFKGLNAIISLGFTVLAIFMVFVPAVLSGHNIYLWSIVTCIYIIIMTMLFINGADKKSFAAGMGCFGGVVMAGILTVIMDKALNLTGMVSEDTLYLQMLPIDSVIDLKGIIFAAIIIGALGAVMDVGMDIASALNELRSNLPDVSSKQLISSGFNIGRDVMGTMSNTLVLAYIGSSLSTTLLFVAYNVTFLELMNMELIVVELLQAIVGSMGILLSIPFTTFICAAIYPRKHHQKI